MINKKRLVSLGVGLGLLLTGQNAFAEEPLHVNINNDHASIFLDWNDIGSNYEVYHNEEKIWSGSKSEFVHKGLQSDFKYNYTIAAFNDSGEKVDSLEVRTTTKQGFGDSYSNKITSDFSTADNTTDDKQALNQISVSSTVNDDEVSIEWDDNIPDDDGIIEIYKNGELIDTTTNSYYVDQDIDYNQQYNYEFVGYKRLPEESVQEIKNRAKEDGYKISPEEEKELFNNTYILAREVSTQVSPTVELNKYQSAAIQAASTNFTLRYTTFIPDYKVPNPFLLGTYFLGNNRSFNKNATSFKTRMDVSISFPNGVGSANLYSTNKKTQKTVLVNGNNTVLDEATASPSGMNIHSVSGSTGRVTFEAYHDIGLPFFDSFSPDITYEFKMHVYPDGGYVIRGTHDKAPSHEIYLTNNSTIIRNIHQKSHQGFINLFPGRTQYSIAASY